MPALDRRSQQDEGRSLRGVGSQGRRRGRRTRSDRPGGRSDITSGVGFPSFEHNQWTFEGQIERLGAFARGSHRVTGWRRTVAVVLALAFLTPLAIGLVSYLVALLNG